ncbi:MAG: phage Gp37/Gp68 family protein [Defluviicoccus sp.]|nr:phage Gp37/Gp68 family protein [Defluviicoccus sp.]
MDAIAGSRTVAQKSQIEWTDATWNPVTGCTKVGPGCDNCYAERFAERWRGVTGHPYEQGFDLRTWPSRLEQPTHWKKPRMIFVNSMSDLFHKGIDRGFIDRVFGVMESADWHVYQVLTKRSSLMRRYIRERYGGRRAPPHIWLGVSVEDAAHARRIEHLKQIDSDARFVSFEPLLGPIPNIDLCGVAWAIVGGESGPRARIMKEEWALGLRDLCDRDGVAFFFKQWGGPRPKSRGRMLDGVEWNGFPWQIVPEPILGQISA